LSEVIVKRTALSLVLLAAAFLPSASAAEATAPRPAHKWLHTAERIAKVAVCASETADALSSYRDSRIAGLHETNSFYAPSGNFSMGRMVAVKSGICAAFLLGSRRSGSSEAAAVTWTALGAGLSITSAYAAISNMRLR
jgi:hypothetical protein